MRPLHLRIYPLLFAVVTQLQGDPRTSANYSIATDTADAAGRRTTSASYANDGSLGGIVGVSSVIAPAGTAKHGYIGQLYEVVALQLSATPTTVNEGATRQISVAQVLDDLTSIAVPAASVTWSVASGPLTGINSNGLATAAAVFQDTAATAQGVFGGITGTLGLTVLESIADNFGTYAGDGLGDDWQVQYFGQPPNANAGPLLDPDHDGHNNRFEFISGIDPTNALSVFSWRIDPVAGFSSQKKVSFSPGLGDRTYTVMTTTTLGTGAVWTPLNPLPGDITDNGLERTVTDTNAPGDRKFYRVDISRL